MKRSNINIEHGLVFTAAAFLMLAVLIFAYTVLAPVDVLKDWSITTDKNTYREGDEIRLTSVSEKVMSVNGTARRYIECKSPNDNKNWYRTPVNEVDVDRKQGKANTDSRVQIPNDINGLPNQCRLYITVEYRIYYYRSFTETATSNVFTLYPAETSPTAEPPTKVDTNTPNGDGQLNSNTPSAPIVQTPIVRQPSKTETPTDTDTPRPIEPGYTPPADTDQPNLVQQLVENLRSLLKI